MTAVANNAMVASLTTRINDDGIETDAFKAWLVKIMLSGAEFPGFWSGEIIPPAASEPTVWRLIERYASIDQARDWKESAIRQQLLGDISAGVLSQDLSTGGSSGTVATAIVTDVRPGMESQYWQWEGKIQTAQAKFPGYAGVYWQPPPPGKAGQWATVLKFDSPESLEKWFASKERRELLAEANEFVEKKQYQKLASSFPGWFPSDAATGAPPAKWKTAMMVYIGLFPAVMLLRRVLLPHLAGLRTELAMAILTATSVSIVTWLIMPFLIKTFRWWLIPSHNATRATTWLGLAAVFSAFAAEIALLCNLLP